MYRFKLEALLNHRRHQEEACQKELTQVRRRLTDEREKLERKKKEKQESLEKLQVKKKVSTTVSDIMLYMNYIQQLSKDIEDQAIEMLPKITAFSRQSIEESVNFEDSIAQLNMLFENCKKTSNPAAPESKNIS